MDILIYNSHAKRDYVLIEEMEAGIQLNGQEVKSVRLKRASLSEAYVRVLNHEVYLVNAHIQQYDHSPGVAYDPTRSRKLLLHQRQVRILEESSQQKGLTIVPLAFGLSHHFIKLKLAIARGKKQFERKRELQQRDIQRETEAAIKHFQR